MFWLDKNWFIFLLGGTILRSSQRTSLDGVNVLVMMVNFLLVGW